MDPGRTSRSAPQDPSLQHMSISIMRCGVLPDPHLTTSISPVKDSRTSRTKKSVLGPPIPVLTIEIGIPLYLPVIVVNPRSEVSLKGVGVASRCFEINRALEGDPTAICRCHVSHKILFRCRLSLRSDLRLHLVLIPDDTLDLHRYEENLSRFSCKSLDEMCDSYWHRYGRPSS